MLACLYEMFKQIRVKNKISLNQVKQSNQNIKWQKKQK